MQLPSPIPHPSLSLLTGLQFRAGARRILRSLRRPKNLLSIAVAVALAAVWLAAAATSVWRRESADARGFEAIIGFSLTAYIGWHLVRIACFRPADPLEQPDNERELLSVLPLHPTDIVTRHLLVLTFAAVVKAAFVTVLMLPELRLPALGWLGIASGLLIVELLRQLLEIVAWAMPRGGFIAYRIAVASSMIAGGIPALTFLQQDFTTNTAGGRGNFLAMATDVAARASSTQVGAAVSIVWSPVVRLITSTAPGTELAGCAAASGGVLVGLTWAVLIAYRRLTLSVVKREQRAFISASRLHELGKSRPNRQSRSDFDKCETIVPRLLPAGGAGSLFWRQAKGASRHAWGLAVAMTPPAALALSPMAAGASAETTFLSVVCALAFYTFLLLPTALKFDFRRDLDRIGLLKSLPVSAWAVAIGQVAAPAALATGFQGAVLAICQGVRPVAPVLPIMALALFSLMNLLVFTVDNFVFLKSPHRLQQEGIAVLLRTMLTFTVKGLLFGFLLTATFAWRAGSQRLAELFPCSGRELDADVLFLGGLLLGLALSVATGLKALAQAVERFDPAEHLPAS